MFIHYILLYYIFYSFVVLNLLSFYPGISQPGRKLQAVKLMSFLEAQQGVFQQADQVFDGCMRQLKISYN
jgi:hypothetical protein